MQRNWQHRGTQDEDKRSKNKKHNTICLGPHYAQTDTDNVNKTSTLSTGGKDDYCKQSSLSNYLCIHLNNRSPQHVGKMKDHYSKRSDSSYAETCLK